MSLRPEVPRNPQDPLFQQWPSVTFSPSPLLSSPPDPRRGHGFSRWEGALDGSRPLLSSTTVVISHCDLPSPQLSTPWGARDCALPSSGDGIALTLAASLGIWSQRAACPAHKLARVSSLLLVYPPGP